MAIDGEASNDRWADGRRRRDEVRTRHLTRELGRRLIVAVVAGLAVGIVLHVLDSAPQALVFLAVALRFLVGFGVFAGVIVGLARAAMQSRPGLLLATVALGIGALVGYPVGPTWIPGATVSGTYTLVFEGTTVPAATGALTCEWLPGRWQVGGLAAIAPVAGPGGERILLHASFAQRQVWIERTGMDGTGRAPYVDATAAVLEPPVAVTGEPQRTADGRAGTTVATLRIDVSSPPAGAPAKWSAPLAIDGAAGVEMQVTWDCAAP
jgi:MFS family permease